MQSSHEQRIQAQNAREAYECAQSGGCCGTIQTVSTCGGHEKVAIPVCGVLGTILSIISCSASGIAAGAAQTAVCAGTGVPGGALIACTACAVGHSIKDKCSGQDDGVVTNQPRCF